MGEAARERLGQAAEAEERHEAAVRAARRERRRGVGEAAVAEPRERRLHVLDLAVAEVAPEPLAERATERHRPPEVEGRIGEPLVEPGLCRRVEPIDDDEVRPAMEGQDGAADRAIADRRGDPELDPRPVAARDKVRGERHAGRGGAGSMRVRSEPSTSLRSSTWSGSSQRDRVSRSAPSGA